MARSAPDTPNNNLTPNVVTLPSAAGFNAGDLVYYKDGDYRNIPGNAVSPASFNVTQSVPTYQQPIGSNIANRISVGSSKGESTALLTNGNVVTVYGDTSTTRPVFVVTTQAGATVVGPTEISTTFLVQQGQAIGVAALSGGGFVVYWLNQSGGTANVPNYAIYSNAGVVVTAATQDAGLGAATASGYIAGVALPNGGFALSYIVSSGTTLVTRAYGATGTPVFAWTTVGNTVANFQQRISMAARSDSSYIVVYTLNTTTFRYAVYSAAGAVLNTNTFSGTALTPGNYTGAPVTATVLADGTTFVIGYSAYSGALSPVFYWYAFRFLPSSFTLGAETIIPFANTSPLVASTKEPGVLSVKALAAGGFVFAFVDPSGAIYYAFFNNSGVAISGTNGSGTLVYPIPGAYLAYIYKDLTIVEYGGNVNLFWGLGDFGATSPMIQTAAINTTTYQLINYQSVTDTIATVTAPASGLANTTTPGAARFTPATTSTQLLTRNIGFTIPATTVAAVASDSIQIASTANGGFVIVYRSTGTFPVTAVVYNQFGGVVQTIAVGNGSGATSARSVAVTVLTSGTLVVAFLSAANTVTLNTYTFSGGTYAAAATTTQSGIATTSTNTRINVTAISNDRFVFSFINNSNNNLSYTVYSSALTLLVGATNIDATSVALNSAAAFTGGGFVLSGRTGSSGFRTYYIRETTPNSFSTVTTSTFANNVSSFTANVVATPGNAVVVTGGLTTPTSLGLYAFDPTGGAIAATQNFNTDNYERSSCVGLTGAGSVVMFFASNFGSSNGRAIAYNSGLDGSDTTPPTSGAQVLTFPNLSTASNGQSQICSAPGVGYNCVFAWIDADNFPTYAMLYAYPATFAATLTSGVSQSIAYPVTINSNLPLNGYVLQGVAVTSAPAGGTGQVQTNGTARLNSNYSPSTPASAFDFQTPNGTNIPGVKGTAIGNTVILEGRS